MVCTCDFPQFFLNATSFFFSERLEIYIVGPAVADLRGHQGRMPPPVPNSFIFMQVSAKKIG